MGHFQAEHDQVKAREMQKCQARLNQEIAKRGAEVQDMIQKKEDQQPKGVTLLNQQVWKDKMLRHYNRDWRL
eukprot:6917515-Prorocentrum_lima.AAC.1